MLRTPTHDSSNLDGVSHASDLIAGVPAHFAAHRTRTELLDLNDAAREVLACSINDLLRCRVRLWQVFADDLPDVPGDRAELHKVILNLLSNALEAMKAVGDRERQRIIRTGMEEGGVRLSVQASGGDIVSFSIPLVAAP